MKWMLKNLNIKNVFFPLSHKGKGEEIATELTMKAFEGLWSVVTPKSKPAPHWADMQQMLFFWLEPQRKAREVDIAMAWSAQLAKCHHTASEEREEESFMIKNIYRMQVIYLWTACGVVLLCAAGTRHEMLRQCNPCHSPGFPSLVLYNALG